MTEYNDLKQIGRRIRLLRQKKGLTQEELGEKAQLHYTYIGQVERGEKVPSLKTLHRLVLALDTELEYLLETGPEYLPGREKSVLLAKLNQILSRRSQGEIALILKLVEELLAGLDAMAGENRKDKT